MGFLVKNIENFNEYKNIQYTNQADAMSLSIIGMIGRSDIALYQTVKNTVLAAARICRWHWSLSSFELS